MGLDDLRRAALEWAFAEKTLFAAQEVAMVIDRLPLASKGDRDVTDETTKAIERANAENEARRMALRVIGAACGLDARATPEAIKEAVLNKLDALNQQKQHDTAPEVTHINGDLLSITPASSCADPASPFWLTKRAARELRDRLAAALGIRDPSVGLTAEWTSIQALEVLARALLPDLRRWASDERWRDETFATDARRQCYDNIERAKARVIATFRGLASTVEHIK